ncbi:hypothetical protein GF336_01950 [Candidatus Woesearchaeota archaeon]|nr:hypothetical protein [Candidatus Woesearchaeota archaeon]
MGLDGKRSSNKDKMLFRAEALRCNKYGFVYAKNTKVMSTSFYIWAINIDFPHLKAENIIWSDPGFRKKHKISFFREYFPEENDYIFTFVRDPYDRLISAFLHIFTQRFPSIKHIKEYMEKGDIRNRPEGDRLISMIKQIRNNHDLEKGISFIEFIDYVTDKDYIPKGRIESHWMAQSEILDVNNFNFIGKFENSDDDIDFLYNKLNIRKEDRTIKCLNKSLTLKPKKGFFAKHHSRELQKNNLHRSLSMANFFSEELKQKIKNKYKEDYQNFGYD